MDNQITNVDFSAVEGAVMANALDFEYLEGKEVEYNYIDGETTTAIVAGCDYDIGITLVEKGNPKNYLFCTPGPCSPNGLDQYPIDGFESYDEEFFNMVEQLKVGKVSPPDAVKDNPWLLVCGGVGPSAETCPFGM